MESWRGHTLWMPFQPLSGIWSIFRARSCRGAWKSGNRWAREKLQRVCPSLVNRNGPILLQGNARPHVARPTLQKLNEFGYGTLPHPPYSPDLSPTDYHFFKHLDNFLREKCFKSQWDAETAFSEFVASRTPEFYSTGITKLLSRWQKCIDCNGLYFD